MNTDRTNTMKHAMITEVIIKAFYHVYNVLGYGFLEKVYQNAMAIELTKQGLNVLPQAKLDVQYEGIRIGEYFADLLVRTGATITHPMMGAMATALRGHVVGETCPRKAVGMAPYELRVGFIDSPILSGVVIVELKAAETLAPEHHAQLLNYLKASSVEVGLLLNFGPKPEFKRKVFDHAIKV